MFEAENIRDWRGHDVVDTDGHKIGSLEAIYVDTGTDLPSFEPRRSPALFASLRPGWADPAPAHRLSLPLG